MTKPTCTSDAIALVVLFTVTSIDPILEAACSVYATLQRCAGYVAFAAGACLHAVGRSECVTILLGVEEEKEINTKLSKSEYQNA